MIRVRATINGFTGLPGLFTAYFVGSASATTPECQEAADRVRAVWESIKSHIAGSTSIQYPSAVDLLDPTTGAHTGVRSVSLGVSTAGVPANPLPLGTVIAGITRTGVFTGGREVRGRSFFGPVVQADVLAGVPTVGLVGAVQTAIGKLGVTIGTPIVPVVWHRPKGANPGLTAAISSYEAASVFSLLRSRRS